MYLEILKFGFGRQSSRGRSRKGQQLRYDISINLNDAFVGTEKKVNYTTYKKCKTCSEWRKPGSKHITAIAEVKVGLDLVRVFTITNLS